MSERAVNKANINPPGKLSAEKRAERERRQHSWWFRWRFHLSGLLMLIPVVLTPFYLEMISLTRADALGARIIDSRDVGPWNVTFAEELEVPPRLNGPAGYMKTFKLALCQQCATEVRAAYLRIGKPRSMRTAGALGFGSPYRMGIQIPVPENTKPDADLWLTLEAWDGTVHRASWPLAEASPATIKFLQNMQSK